jgi:hypothetical protein
VHKFGFVLKQYIKMSLMNLPCEEFSGLNGDTSYMQ